MSRSPNYRMKRAYMYSMGSYDTRTIDSGAYVRPVEFDYVPAHIKEDKRWSNFDKTQHVFIYTRHGFVMIPREYLVDE